MMSGFGVGIVALKAVLMEKVMTRRERLLMLSREQVLSGESAGSYIQHPQSLFLGK